MATLADSAIEFRCKSCWQQIYAPVETFGSSMGCPHCNVQCEVPAPTEANLCSASQIAQQESKAAEPEQDLSNLSTSELYKVASQGAHCEIHEMDFSGYPLASLWSRLGAAILDGMFNAFVAVLGLFSLIGALKLGVFDARDLTGLFEEMPFEGILIFYFPVLLGQILQWNLIATRGQSIGKFICCIRIVSMNGRTPGFFFGVVLRDWSRYILGLIPFFGLIDIAFIFTDSKRCIHDHIAGTRVVQA